LCSTLLKSNQIVSKKLYVGGLPYEVTQEELQELFAKAGNVESSVVITDKFTGNSKGFGFVEMTTEEEAQKAMEMFDNYELGGRKIKVNEARPLGDRPPRRDGFSGGRRDFGGRDSF